MSASCHCIRYIPFSDTASASGSKQHILRLRAYIRTPLDPTPSGIATALRCYIVLDTRYLTVVRLKVENNNVDYTAANL
ncbi:hypothetical protein MTP99_013892 [Tenebrio molitor]|jgi:hypothetical protein|nr:hypothetical protein MTP99_013892 [Tenebrio molitor]